MSQAFTKVAIGLVASTTFLLPACAAETSSSDEVVAQSHEALALPVVCKVTNTCCVSSSTSIIQWDLTDPFQAQLSAWGCTKPRLYQPYQTVNGWWYYAQCTDPSQRIEAFLASKPTYLAAPWSATISTTLDTACVTKPPSGSVDVVWDPTCSTCKLR
jgi:hypothetical protein